jgi:predicted alpha/beta superfamily hydrolase
MGALISFYAIVQYPNVFGAAGVLSPSFWINDEIFGDAEKFTTTATPRFYMYAGKQEPANMVTGNDKMISILQKKQKYSIRSVTAPLGKHNEKTWREEFASFYYWLMMN